jgi:HAD superfamily hydrolase (TIGR01509 family)
MPQIKAVIFDMDGLMFDTESIYYKANQKTADELGLPFDYPFYEKYIGASDEDFFAAIYEANDDKKLVDAFIKKSREDWVDYLLNVSLPKKKGLVELLDFLREKGCTLVVASSTERWLVDQLLKKAEVDHYFDGVVGGDEVERSKPNPAIFLKAWEKTTAKKEETLILEDSLNGIRAAYDAGIPVIMVPDLFEPNDEAKEKTVTIYEDLLEVKEYVKQNLASK